MGFRSNTYAKVWGVEPKTETNTNVQLSISRKKKDGSGYDTEFSGFVSFVGTACAKKAAALKEGDRIKLGEVDVTTFFSKEKNQKYTTFKCFTFEDANFSDGGQRVDNTDPQPTVDSGDLDDSRLPF